MRNQNENARDPAPARAAGALPATVIVCVSDAKLGGLIAVNLARRGYNPYATSWPALRGAPSDVRGAARAVVADLDVDGSACWDEAPRLRRAFPTAGLVLLSHEWPRWDRLHDIGPCTHLRKPLAIGELLGALRELVGESRG